jgi:hypothetical protein
MLALLLSFFGPSILRFWIRAPMLLAFRARTLALLFSIQVASFLSRSRTQDTHTAYTVVGVNTMKHRIIFKAMIFLLKVSDSLHFVKLCPMINRSIEFIKIKSVILS